nr:MAG TPA: hypothetical protein [Caudoviricetes sp.]
MKKCGLLRQTKSTAATAFLPWDAGTFVSSPFIGEIPFFGTGYPNLRPSKAKKVRALQMTIESCQDAVLELFTGLYPKCTVALSYPGMSERPPLPYILLDFGKVDSQRVDNSFDHGDGILYQSVHQSMMLTVDLVRTSQTTHTKDGRCATHRATAVQDLTKAVNFLDSSMAEDQLFCSDIAISVDSGPQPVYGSPAGIDRARCSMTVNFTMTSKEYAALHPVDGEYEDSRPSMASKALADSEAGYFTAVKVEIDAQKGEKLA